MRIIDLLNKIANGEEVPKKIEYDTILFTFNEKDKTYENCNSDLSEFMVFNARSLNDTVEIPEEENKIEKLELLRSIEHGEEILTVPSEKMILMKINEIIDEINKLKEDK